MTGNSLPRDRTLGSPPRLLVHGFCRDLCVVQIRRTLDDPYVPSEQPDDQREEETRLASEAQRGWGPALPALASLADLSAPVLLWT